MGGRREHIHRSRFRRNGMDVEEGKLGNGIKIEIEHIKLKFKKLN